MKRTSEEYILIALAFTGSIAILPFAIYRFLESEWYVAAADMVMVVGMFMIGVYVYMSRDTKLARVALSTIAISGVVIVIHLKGYTLLYWIYPTMVGVFYILRPNLALVITFLGVIAVSPALLRDMDSIGFLSAFMTMIVMNFYAYVFASKMYGQSKQLSLLIRKDPLTGVGNRRALEEKLDDFIAGQKRTHTVASLIIFDLDYFKNINDVHGHIAGDQVLIKLTEIINSRIRASDNLYRFGGEEFVIIAVGSPESSAMVLAEELRELTESSNLFPDTITISLGVAEYKEDENSDDWINRCDTALYQAKSLGRNKVCISV